MARKGTEVRWPGSIPANARIELLMQLWQYPAYPEKLAGKITFEALRGVQLSDGRILAVAGKSVVRSSNDQSVEFELSRDFRSPTITVYGYKDAWYSPGSPKRVALPGNGLPPTGSTSIFPLSVDLSSRQLVSVKRDRTRNWSFSVQYYTDC